MFDKIVEIYKTGLRAADPAPVVRHMLRLHKNRLEVRTGRHHEISESYELGSKASVLVVGCGKAAASMAMAVEEVLGDRIRDGIVAVKYGCAQPLRRVRLIEGGHPWPDQNCVNAAAETQRLLSSVVPPDIVLALLSGGGSSLWTLPPPGVDLQDIIRLTGLLLESGANISEINTLRKHISRISGGFAAQWTYPTKVLVIAVSDVPGDSFETIASGPFSPDESTFADCLKIIEKYGIYSKIPVSVAEYFQSGINGIAPETPKIAGDFSFENVDYLLAVTNKTALESCAAHATAIGLKPLMQETFFTGEAADAAYRFCLKIKEISQLIETGTNTCLISGGETTVTLGENYGKGGRNQEFALAAALEIEGNDSITILACGTDGTDGPTDAAGAVVDGQSAGKMRKLGFDPADHLRCHNAYPALDAAGCLIRTGPTCTNVMDVRIAVFNS
ncbi:MAG: DUF4147 domain-containing protein [Chitinispirillales bacterium]|jgi:hydroxypyruvate reductase|nr:DUF4147 domain-containing protein [Chitinispirillales bacterium]